MPSRLGPLAAQSRDEPEPYSLPASTSSGHALRPRTPSRRRRSSSRSPSQDGHAALGARRELVAQPHVGERAAHHHLVVAAPRAVGVEVPPLDAVLEQVAPGGRVLLDRAGGRDVVGGDAVAQQRQRARAADLFELGGLLGVHAVEVGRRLRRSSRRPRRSGRPRASSSAVPVLVALEHLAVAAPEHVRLDRPARSHRRPRAARARCRQVDARPASGSPTRSMSIRPASA